MKLFNITRTKALQVEVENNNNKLCKIEQSDELLQTFFVIFTIRELQNEYLCFK